MEPEDSDEARLGRPRRVVAAVLGLAGTGTGAVAVFVTGNELGSTALITVGVYFVLAANLGHYPRLKFGDNEIDPTARRLARDARNAAAEARRVATDAQEDASDAKEGLVAAAVFPAGTGTGRALDADPVPELDPLVRELATRYNAVRYTMPNGDDRFAKMTEVFEEMIARFRVLGSAAAAALLSSGDRGLRLAGAAAAYAEPRAELAPLLTTVGVTTDRPFNEYQTLRALRRLAEQRPDALSEHDVERLRARLRDLPPGGRTKEIHRILRILDAVAHPGSPPGGQGAGDDS
jgi:hypothetical protein